jgi:predicted Zn-dependent protease
MRIATILSRTAIATLALAMAGCPKNPATGERHLTLVSESQEIAMGKEADGQIATSLGLVEDKALQSYIQELGTRLAALTERPKLPWTFRVVDDPVVNAFALPGGYIYFTRGILVHLNNEAELAGVMGHEIGHVTAQHSVHQMSTQQLAQIGLVAGMIVKPELQQYAQLASLGLSLMFLKFSRDDERQADELGLRYMRRANYDPRQMVEIFTMLDRVSQAVGGGRVPEWLSTHPDPGNRRDRITSQIDTMKGDFRAAKVEGDPYLRRLDGIVFGQNPREGFFRGTTFYHPEMRFRFDFPQGWQTVNQKQSVIGVSQNQDAILQITIGEGASPDAAAQKFLSQQGIQAGPLERSRVNGFPVVSAGFLAQTDQAVLQGVASFLQYDQTVFQILGYAAQQQWPSYQSVIVGSTRSFDRVNDAAILNVQPMRLRIARVDRPMTLQEFARANPSPVSIDQLALVNQMEPNTRLASGQLIKLVVGSPLPEGIR